MALERWPAEGTPDNAGAWITTTARNRAIDRLRRDRRYADKLRVLEAAARRSEADAAATTAVTDRTVPRHAMDDYPDDRLALMFACCHPALAREAQVALALRTLGGLTTREIARAFLEPEPTVAQRLSRAKRKIREAAIPIAVPSASALEDRIAVVLAAVYFVFNEGYLSTSAGTLVRADLAAEAIRLGRLLAELLPGEPEVLGLLALMLLHDSRRATRTDERGDMVLLADQDRALWDRDEIEEGLSLLTRALGAGRAGPYQVQAAIAAVHAEAGDAERTDWGEIVALYDRLMTLAPSPVVALNRAAAVSMRDGPVAGLELLDELAADRHLRRYHLFHSARGSMLDRVGDRVAAAEAFSRALELATNPVDRRFLQRRLRDVSS